MCYTFSLCSPPFLYHQFWNNAVPCVIGGVDKQSLPVEALLPRGMPIAHEASRKSTLLYMLRMCDDICAESECSGNCYTNVLLSNQQTGSAISISTLTSHVASCALFGCHPWRMGCDACTSARSHAAWISFHFLADALIDVFRRGRYAVEQTYASWRR